MRIKFELETDIFGGIKHSYNKWVCKRKGHDLDKVPFSPFAILDTMIPGHRQPEKYCKRCGHTVYAKIKKVKLKREDIAGNLDFEDPKKKLVN